MLGKDSACCDGFLSRTKPVPLDGMLAMASLEPPLLILNGLPDEERVVSPEQLAEAMDYGTQAQQRGEPYHPAVNNKLDELTGGQTARLQLEGILANATLAEGIGKINKS